jgi:hypothetical protein
VILTVGISPPRLRLVVIEEQPRLPCDLLAVPHALGLAQIVIEQVVAPAHPIKQMTGGQIDVGLVVGVAPDVVTGRGFEILLRGVKIFPVAFDLIGQRGLGDSDADFILRAALLRRRSGRIRLQRANLPQRALP